MAPVWAQTSEQLNRQERLSNITGAPAGIQPVPAKSAAGLCGSPGICITYSVHPYPYPYPAYGYGYDPYAYGYVTERAGSDLLSAVEAAAG